jgi:hypothetical protein
MLNGTSLCEGLLVSRMMRNAKSGSTFSVRTDEDPMVIVYLIDNHLLFVGDDKFENDGLIKYSQRYMRELNAPVFWFHVDDLSSPHAYVRLNEGESTPPPNMVQLCAQIVKNGSIEGVKRPAVDVIYTLCSNLTKSKGMKVGQVSFQSSTAVTYVRGVRKDNALIKQLEKAKETKSIPEMDAELDDLIRNAKKNKKPKAAAEPDWGDDDWDTPVVQPKKPAASMMAGVEKAEFSTNLEEDFM